MAILRCGNTVVECSGVVFDKDGTLIDSLQIWPELIRIRARILQKKLDLEEEVVEMVKRVMGLNDKGKVFLRSAIVIGTRE